jgi:hypothetical protein
MEFIVFVLATIGLVLLTNKSTLFKPLREKITSIYDKKNKNILLWVLNNIFSCYMCMSPYAGALIYVILYLDIKAILYVFACIPCVVFFMSIHQLIERK